MKIYISGPITGHEDYMERFAEAEKQLTEYFENAEIINPARIHANLPESTTWEEYMKFCYLELDMVDAVCMMPGWKKSAGACIEYGYALANSLSIFNLESTVGKKGATKHGTEQGSEILQ